MPFNFKEYEQQCSRMSRFELKQQIDHLNDVVATAGIGTGVAVLAIPITFGISAVAVGGTAPALINARKKRTIAKKYLASLGPEAPITFPTHPTGMQFVHRSAGSSSRVPLPEDRLPAYSAGRNAPQTSEKQTYVPSQEVQMDLPPSYDEATIKRMSMMGGQAPFGSDSGLASPAYTSPTGPSPHPHSWRSVDHETSSVRSLHELPGGHEHSSPPASSYSPSISAESPIGPRTPSPSHNIASPNLTAEEESSAQRVKGKAASNPTIVQEESVNLPSQSQS